MSRSQHWLDRVASFKKAESASFFKRPLIFAGDSLTEQFDLACFFPGRPLVNHGISGDHIDGLTERLGISLKFHPQALFAMIGINDIFDDMDSGTLYARYNFLFDGLITAKTGDIPVFCFSLLPVGDQWAGAERIGKIREMNDFLSRKCMAAHLDFLNIYPRFTTDGKSLNPIYTTDGIHLSDLGYTQWRDVLMQWDQPFVQKGADIAFQQLL